MAASIDETCCFRHGQGAALPTPSCQRQLPRMFGTSGRDDVCQSSVAVRRFRSDRLEGEMPDSEGAPESSSWLRSQPSADTLPNPAWSDVAKMAILFSFLAPIALVSSLLPRVFGWSRFP